jgi:hypothetical protein
MGRSINSDAVADDLPSEDTLRMLRYEEYLKERIQSEYTVGSAHTVVVDDGEFASSHSHDGEGGFDGAEFGYRPCLDPAVVADATLVAIDDQMMPPHSSIPVTTLTTLTTPTVPISNVLPFDFAHPSPGSILAHRRERTLTLVPAPPPPTHHDNQMSGSYPLLRGTFYGSCPM